jgi:hypothetical protein
MKKGLVFLGAAILLVAFTAPAFAAEWSFYGSSRIYMFWEAKDKEVLPILDEDRQPTYFDDTDLNMQLQSNSRIGANVNAGDHLSGRFELGMGGTSDDEVNLRILKGEWNFGAGTFIVGQDYGPAMYFPSNQVANVDQGLVGWGAPYTGRNPLLGFRFGNFYFAFIKPSTSGTGIIPNAVDTDTMIPKIEARWNNTWGPFFMEIGAGYNTVDDVDQNDREESIDSYIAYLGLKYTIGAFFVGGDIYIAKNGGAYGVSDGDVRTSPTWANNAVQDTDQLGFVLLGNYKFNDMVSVEGGFGSLRSESDDPALPEKDKAMSYYLQLMLTLAKGVYIIPEVTVNDWKEDYNGLEQGKVTYYGAQFRINF